MKISNMVYFSHSAYATGANREEGRITVVLGERGLHVKYVHALDKTEYEFSWESNNGLIMMNNQLCEAASQKAVNFEQTQKGDEALWTLCIVKIASDWLTNTQRAETWQKPFRDWLNKLLIPAEKWMVTENWYWRYGHVALDMDRLIHGVFPANAILPRVKASFESAIIREESKVYRMWKEGRLLPTEESELMKRMAYGGSLYEMYEKDLRR